MDFTHFFSNLWAQTPKTSSFYQFKNVIKISIVSFFLNPFQYILIVAVKGEVNIKTVLNNISKMVIAETYLLRSRLGWAYGSMDVRYQ